MKCFININYTFIYLYKINLCIQNSADINTYYVSKTNIYLHDEVQKLTLLFVNRVKAASQKRL